MKPHLYVLDENGNPKPIDDVLAWGSWLETTDRQVAEDFVDNRIRVSTIFLGLDHSWDEGPPVLWETMLFGDEGAPFQQGEQMRYRSREDALKGHKRAIGLAERILQEFDAKMVDRAMRRGTGPLIRRED